MGKVGTGRPYREMAAFQDWLAKRPEVDAGPDRHGRLLRRRRLRHPVCRARRPRPARHRPVLRGACRPTSRSSPTSARLWPRTAGGTRRWARTARSWRPRSTPPGIPNDVKTYPDAGHSFMSQHEGLMAKVAPMTPMHSGFDPDASEDAWARVLAFFGEHLAPRSGLSGPRDQPPATPRARRAGAQPGSAPNGTTSRSRPSSGGLSARCDQRDPDAVGQQERDDGHRARGTATAPSRRRCRCPTAIPWTVEPGEGEERDVVERPPGALADPAAQVEAGRDEGHEVERDLADADGERRVRRRARHHHLRDRERHRWRRGPSSTPWMPARPRPNAARSWCSEKLTGRWAIASSSLVESSSPYTTDSVIAMYAMKANSRSNSQGRLDGLAASTSRSRRSRRAACRRG